MSKCIILISSLSSDQIQIVNTRRLQDAVSSKKLLAESIDGSLPENKDKRDKLFGLSSQRGKYPQCFIENESGDTEFVGLWDEIESLLDCDGLPADVLSSHPEIKTFTSVFAKVTKL